MEKRYSIMLIDDSSTNNILYESILEDEGYQVYVFDDAQKALNQIETISPDLIMLDLMMPGMDGFDFLDRKKQLSNVASVPVVMVTARTDKESEKKAFELGVKEYLLKPAGILEVTQLVKKILQ
jgi:DNA-binding response OmpR family regulator